MYLVAYDVETTTPEGERRLRRVAKICEGFGQRVQKSVFEVVCDRGTYLKLRASLLSVIDPQRDSLRIYNLPEDAIRRIERHGRSASFDASEPWIW